MVAKTGPFDQRAQEYDRWFDEHEAVYLSELEAVRALMPEHSRPAEVGVGTGRFAQPLGIARGAEPSRAMRDIARRRGIEAVDAIAEDLPFGDGAFDLVLMVTTVCFLDDVDRAFREAHRVLAEGGHILIGLLDRDTTLGQTYEARKAESKFYCLAQFRSTAEVLYALTRVGFRDLVSVQTIFDSPSDLVDRPSPVEPGHGAGLFVVVRGLKGAGRREGRPWNVS